MRGLNPSLQAAYYPHYTFARANKGGYEAAHHPPADLPLNPKRSGHAVDRQISHMTALMANGATWSDKKLVTYLTTKCCGYIRDQLVPYLQRQKVLPTFAQFPVAHVPSRTGTALDLVCRDERQRYVVYEIKVGYGRYYLRHSAIPMRTPHQKRNDSIKEQHQLYLAHAVDMLQRQEPDIKINRGKCAVLVMRSTGLHVYPLTPAPVAASWRTLATLKDLNKRQRGHYVAAIKRKRMQ